MTDTDVRVRRAVRRAAGLALVLAGVASCPGEPVGRATAPVPVLSAWLDPGAQVTPAFAAASPMGWRCAGEQAQRRCADRTALASPFRCDEQRRCEQRFPRMPDVRDFSCAVVAGATLCLGGAVAAGVAPLAPEPGWTCGSVATRAEHEGTVCRDLDPDYPDADAGAWDCRFESGAPPRRVCVPRGADAGPGTRLGDACDAVHACREGSRCVAGRCQVGRAVPDCWIDADCARGRCRLGNCLDRAGGPP